MPDWPSTFSRKRKTSSPGHGMRLRSQASRSGRQSERLSRLSRGTLPPVRTGSPVPRSKRLKREPPPSPQVYVKREELTDEEIEVKHQPGPSRKKQYPKASLLGLPGELRNRIFRLILLEKDLILINRQSALQPGILRTCRQLRSEARGIFEEENSFFVEAWDLKLRIPPNTEKHWLLDLNYKISLKGSHNWPNLRDWLHGYYDCNLRGLADGQPTHWSKLVQRAFAQVDILRKDIDNWRKIEATLDNWKRTSELSGQDWED